MSTASKQYLEQWQVNWVCFRLHALNVFLLSNLSECNMKLQQCIRAQFIRINKFYYLIHVQSKKPLFTKSKQQQGYSLPLLLQCNPWHPLKQRKIHLELLTSTSDIQISTISVSPYKSPATARFIFQFHFIKQLLRQIRKTSLDIILMNVYFLIQNLW